jgi:hypothetical protein
MCRSSKKFAVLIAFSVLIPITLASTRLPDEPGASPGVALIDISGNSAEFSSAFPSLAVNPANDQEIGIAWRIYSLPIDTNAPRESRTAECHVSLSTDGAKTFHDTNLMNVLRTERVDSAHPELWYCNAPWVSFGEGQTVYAGGSLFTANGVTGPEPKQGRAMVSASFDGGATWSKGIPGITIDKLAPGLSGLSGGHYPQDTPWDGSSGVADSRTGTMYSTAGAYVAASDDRGKTFGTVFSPSAPGWIRQGGGSFAVSFGAIAIAGFVKSAPVADAKCPCLAFGESSDKGAHWMFRLVTGAADVSATGRPHYPPMAADPLHPGHFAIATTSADKQRLEVFFTSDNGESWSSASPNPPPKGTVNVTTVDMPGVGFTSSGDVVSAWRGFRAAGAYDVYAAAIIDGKFGPTLKLDEEASAYPPLVQVGNYSLGGGDFSTPVSGNRTDVFVAFPYSPGGSVQRTTLARVSLAQMR